MAPFRNESVGQVLAAPLHVSATSQTPVDGRQTKPSGRNASAGQVTDEQVDQVVGGDPRLQQLVAIMAQMKEAKKGMRIELDWTPGSGTRVAIDGKPAGYLKSSGIAHATKSKIELGVAGKDGWFDDIKVWNAEPVKH